MIQITRSSIIQAATQLLGIQSATNRTISQSNETINPVVEVGPKFSNILKRNSRSTTGSTTLYTTPTLKDFYLTYALITLTKDVVSDNQEALISVVVDGVATRVISVIAQPTTAESYNNSVAFTYPIKVDRGTAISLTNTFGAGTSNISGIIAGFILE